MSAADPQRVHVCRPAGVWARGVRTCPVCGERRRQVALLAVWYPTLWTCCGCGDSYSQEGLLPRPFARGWRAEARTKARARWGTAKPWAEAAAELVRIAQAELRGAAIGAGEDTDQ